MISCRIVPFKAIVHRGTQSQRPGSVVQLAEHPQNSNRLLIGYSSGLLVLWDLRAKAAEARFHYFEEKFMFQHSNFTIRPLDCNRCLSKNFNAFRLELFIQEGISKLPALFAQMRTGKVDGEVKEASFTFNCISLNTLPASYSQLKRGETTTTLYSFCWHWEGKGFISAHSSGTIVTWALNQPKQPQSVICPHAGEEEVPDSSQYAFESIRCVQWLPSKIGEKHRMKVIIGRTPIGLKLRLTIHFKTLLDKK
ncbi:hypothetical protein ACTXT7_004315 [Hymenolepis weldensis]